MTESGGGSGSENMFSPDLKNVKKGLNSDIIAAKGKNIKK